jgi:hypothetical protein
METVMVSGPSLDADEVGGILGLELHRLRPSLWKR